MSGQPPSRAGVTAPKHAKKKRTDPGESSTPAVGGSAIGATSASPRETSTTNLTNVPQTITSNPTHAQQPSTDTTLTQAQDTPATTSTIGQQTIPGHFGGFNQPPAVRISTEPRQPLTVTSSDVQHTAPTPGTGFQSSTSASSTHTQQAPATAPTNGQQATTVNPTVIQETSAAATANTHQALVVDLVDERHPDFGDPRATRGQHSRAPGESLYVKGAPFIPDKVAISTRLEVHAGKLDQPVRQDWAPDDEKVITNHFKVAFDAKKMQPIHKYQILNIPPGVTRATKKLYIRTAIRAVTHLANNQRQFAVDDEGNIVSWVNLHGLFNSVLQIGNECDLVTIQDNGHQATLRVKYAGEVDVGSLLQFCDSAHPTPGSYDPEITLKELNTVLTKFIQNPGNNNNPNSPNPNPSNNDNIFFLNAHKFFIKSSFKDLIGPLASSASLRLMRGYSYTLKAGMGGLLLNVNAVTSAFWKPRWMHHILNNPALELSTFNGDIWAMKGVRVYLQQKYRDNSTVRSRIKTIQGFGKACNKESFKFEDTRRTVEEHIIYKYRGTLQRPDLPAVDLGSPGAPSWFAPEHLQILPNQIWSKIIPDRVAEAFHGVSRQNPKANRGRIEREGIDCFRKGQGDELGDCRFIHLNSTMLSIPSTSLPYPSIMYRNTNAARVDGYRWNLGNKKFLSPPVPSVSWTFLCEQGVAPIAFQNFEHHFETQLAACGVVNQAAHVTKLGATHTLDFGSDKYGRDNRLKYITLQLENIARESPDIVVLMLRQKNQEHYSMFKYLADKMFVIHSICVTEANFKPKPKPLYRDGPLLDWTHPNAPRHWTQYAANVVMKANLKNSGWNHSASGIEPTLKDTLILGADLTHPGTSAVEGCPSIAAVVGSVHSSGGKFPGMLRLQPKVELVVHLQSMVQAILERWCKLHWKWPARIIYYRDGVSKGEYPDIIKHELSGIKKAISALAQQKRMEEPDIKLAVIIVTKRHHTRFYPAKPADQTSTEWPVNENLKPGTLVDSAVTNPYFVDFYLQTHIGIIGTARPARYDIIHNSTGYSTGRLRDLTHNLNHTYVRATLGVSYAAPAYYADRLCERGRCYLREWYNPSSDKRDEFRRKKLEFQKAQPRSNMNGTKPVKSNAKTQHDLDVEEANREEVNKKMKDYAGQQILPRWYVSKANTTPPSWWPTHLDPYRGNESEFHDTMYWM